MSGATRVENAQDCFTSRSALLHLNKLTLQAFLSGRQIIMLSYKESLKQCHGSPDLKHAAVSSEHAEGHNYISPHSTWLFAQAYSQEVPLRTWFKGRFTHVISLTD